MLNEHTGLHNLIIELQVATVYNITNLRLGSITSNQLTEHHAQHNTRCQQQREENGML
jgi:hypothetical protein